MLHEPGTLGRPTVVAPDGTYEAAELEEAACKVASGLLRIAGRESLAEARIAFCVPPSFAHLAVQRGIWTARGIAVPLAVSHPPAELDYVIRDTGAAVVVGDAAMAESLAPLAQAAGARFTTSADSLNSAGPGAAGLKPRGHGSDGAGRALILYTSGTTARPKGVVTTHANLAAQIDSLVRAWEWTSNDHTLLVLPLHHVHGIVNVVGCALASGATLEILSRFDAETTWARLASGEITVFTAVPTIYRRLIQCWDAAPPERRRAWSEGSSRARLMMSGSAALPVATLERWREITGQTLLERYGMTEIGMALSNPLHGPRHPGRVGTPLPGVEVRLVDEHGAPAAEGTAGELEVRGPGVFLEYWQRPEETARAFRDGWFRTGDVASVEGGVHRLLGRTSVDIIKTGGYKVSALEIEEVVREHPAVADCAVVSVPDPDWGERVCAAVELRAQASLCLAELQGWSRSRLAPYKVPRDLRCVPALPRNAMGKVIKPEVGKLFQATGFPQEGDGFRFVENS
jgi:malonyl-CoA/methylmalonyl-CoA synthetase